MKNNKSKFKDKSERKDKGKTNHRKNKKNLKERRKRKTQTLGNHKKKSKWKMNNDSSIIKK